ncbi:MAG: ABC transporter permease [Actinomycetota bacterium]|nr:ABC transporter permease [Actinomycetota bacterium]
MSPLVAFGRFEVLRLVRSWRFIIITVGFPVVFYMLFLGDHTPSKAVAGTVPWRAYLMVSMCSFGALVAGLTSGGARLSAERASGWARQLRVTPIPTWSYVLTKVSASMLVILPVIILVEIVGATFGGVQLAARIWFELAAVLWVSSVPFAALGVLVGFTVNAETAFATVTGLMFVLGYFGGLFNPVSSMPSVLRSAATALPNYHHDQLGLSLIQGTALGLEHWAVLVAYTAAIALAVMMRHRKEELKGTA